MEVNYKNHYMKVLDIRQPSEKNIIFYHEQINSAITKIPTIDLDQAAKASITDLGKLLSNYRMSLYIFAFSSFLELLLLGIFRHEYHDQVASKVYEYKTHYQNQFSKCHDMIMKFSAASVEAKVFEGIGNTDKALGRFISSVSFLAQRSVDKWLQEGGEELLKGNEEKIAKTVYMFSVDDKIGNELFIDIIRILVVSAITTKIYSWKVTYCTWQ